MIVENQKVKIKCTSTNKEWYESKGYTYKVDEFVDVNDLIRSNKSDVKVVCDHCGKEFTKKFYDIVKGRKTIKKDSCYECVGRKCADVTLLKRQNKFYEKLLEQSELNGYELLSNKEDILNNTTYIKYRCKHHGVHEMRLANYLNGKGCPECVYDKARERYQFKKEEIERQVYDCGGFLLNAEDYINNQTKNLKVLCPECRKPFITSLRSFTQHGTQLCQDCSIGTESVGEREIRLYLESNKIDFKQEYWFPDCRDTNPLPFDFYIPSYNLAIEFQGSQHYYDNGFFTYTLEKVVLHDNMKMDYCINNGIKLIRIPYWRFNKIKDILDNEFHISHEDIV